MPLQLLKTVFVSILITICFYGKAQLIDNTSSFRNIGSKSYFRFHYDNDYFTKTDYYYSQGITLEYAHPGLKKFLVFKFLIKPKNSDSKYGITYNLFGYTPTSIRIKTIQYGDRPYSSAMSFKTFVAGADSIHRHRIAAALSIGILGPAAQGKQIQTGIHRWIKDELPQGWDNQIKNDIIINYQLNFEKKLAETGKGFLLNGTVETRLGTLHNKIEGGINFMAGHFTDPYKTGKRKRTEYYFYGQSRVNLIAYDGLMQGGLFNRKSPYVIPTSDVSRITFQADAGMILNFRKLYLSYTQSFLTKEFRTGKYHRWGGISLGFSF